MTKRKIGFGALGIVNNMQEIITCTEGCEITEGNVNYVTSKYIENTSKSRYSYSLYSAGIIYTDQRGKVKVIFLL